MDHALDAENFVSYMRIVKYLAANDTQVFLTSFRPQILELNGLVIQSVEYTDSSKFSVVDYDFAQRALESSH